MSWLSFDDSYTRQAVWDDLPYDTRWHYHAIVETCCAQRRYDGRLRWTIADRCSDVPDPARCAKELLGVGLLRDIDGQAVVPDISHFLPPEGERDEILLPRKRANQREYRRRKCERGEHDRHCPAKTCPAKSGRVTERVSGNPGTGRVGTGRDGQHRQEPVPPAGAECAVNDCQDPARDGYLTCEWHPEFEPAESEDVCRECGEPLDLLDVAGGRTAHLDCLTDGDR